MGNPILKVDGLINAIDAYIKKADEDLEKQLAAEGFAAAGAAVAAINEIEDAVRDALEGHADRLLAKLEEADSIEAFLTEAWPGIKSEKELRDALEKILRQQFQSLMGECVQDFLVDADKALAIDRRITKPAQDFIESWSSQLAGLMHLNTNKQIEKILLDSQEKALSIEQVADAIGRSGIRSPGWRARRVAQTEVLRIESYAQLEYMRQDPSVEEKEWVHTGAHKNRPRENHVEMNGQRVAVEERFELECVDRKTRNPMCPRDICLPASETVNCHCIMKQIRNEKVMGMSVDERRALREKYMDEVDAEWERNYNIDLFGEEESSDIQATVLPEHMKKYVPDKERRKEIIKRGIDADKPIFDDGRLGAAAKYIKPEENYYDVVLHGSPNFVEFFGESIDAETLSAIIIQREDYTKGKAIRLISCCTGQEENGVAQFIANKLNVEVLAPTENVSLYYGMNNGKKVTTLEVESAIGEKDGEWVSFTPKEREGD
ncbi:MAG: hypothetical protein HFH38_00875 [Lachnospiraceae bacterium]|jgi:hypothetical protein|nr:hypothetical protein [Lachnospiraceae bacterium]